jgi:RNA recognition motif-containing protein
MNIYVSNLSISVQREDLKKQFSPYGEVSLINIIMNRDTNRSSGFAFVEMRNKSAAEKAIRELNGIMMDGRSIKVKESSRGGNEGTGKNFY